MPASHLMPKEWQKEENWKKQDNKEEKNINAINKSKKRKKKKRKTGNERKSNVRLKMKEEKMLYCKQERNGRHTKKEAIKVKQKKKGENKT